MISKHFDRTFRLMVRTSDQDNIGGESISYSEIPDSDFDGKLDQLSASERKFDSRTNYESTHMLFCEADITLSQSGRIKDTTNNKEYHVISFDPIGNHHIEAIVSEVIK